MDIKQYLEKKGKMVEEALKRFLPASEDFPSEIHTAMRYSLFAGGKRIRPILALAAAQAVGGELSKVLPAACALEMIHTYSLIHDDLPAIDNDDLRRGRPTSHKVFGEAMAVLAGDALLTQAFIVLSAPDFVKTVGPAKAAAAVHEIAQAAGSRGMVGGQTVDILSTGKTLELPTLEYIHTHKTGALIRASVRVGGILAGARKKQLEILNRYGEKVGLVFQIVDDILDVEGKSEELGKTAGKDRAAKKITYPAYYGLEESRRRAQELILAAKEGIKPLGKRAQALKGIADLILSRQK